MLFPNVQPDAVHAAIDARADFMERRPLTLAWRRAAAAADVVRATRMLGGRLDDALKLVRRTWVAQQGASR